MRVGGLPAAVAQWQSTGSSSQGCLGFGSAAAGLFTFLYFHLITSKFIARIHLKLSQCDILTTVLKILVAISIMPYGDSYSLNLGVCLSYYLFYPRHSGLSKLFLGGAVPPYTLIVHHSVIVGEPHREY